MQIAIDLPNDFVELMTEPVIARDMRLSYALALFREARVTVSKAAELAGMSLYDFMGACKAQRIPVIDTDRDALEREMHAFEHRA